MNNEQFYVKRCLIVEKHNLLVLGLNDAKNENISKLEVHSFKYLGNLRDSFHAEHFNNILRAESLAKDEIFENLDIQEAKASFLQSCLSISTSFCGGTS